MGKHKKFFIIFDMDGLLVDSEKTYSEGWAYSFQKSGLDISQTVINSWVGKSVQETTEYLKDYTDDVERIRAFREEYIYQELEQGRLLQKPYAAQVLAFLQARGYKIGLATSSARGRSVDILTRLQLLQHIDVPVFSDDVEKLKPEPDLYLEAMRRADVSAKDSLVVEDSLTGAKAANRAGIPAILVPDHNFALDESKIPQSVVLRGENLLCVLEYLEESPIND